MLPPLAQARQQVNTPPVRELGGLSQLFHRDDGWHARNAWDGRYAWYGYGGPLKHDEQPHGAAADVEPRGKLMLCMSTSTLIFAKYMRQMMPMAQQMMSDPEV